MFRVRSGKRGAQIAREWQAAWEGGPGVVSTPIKATHPEFGALWGDYRTLKDNPAQPAKLLGGLVQSPEAWAKLVASWVAGDPVTRAH